MLIIHGYSDGSSSFTSLKDFFIKEAKFKRDNVYFVDYSSMDDQSTFRDFADKLDFEYSNLFRKGTRINVACHSTGALIVRIWLALRRQRQKELGQIIDCPVKRIFMLAPANFGSDLAKMGQSFLGKVRSTFFNSNSRKEDPWESGKIVLQGLEPASPFQWNLSNFDLYEEDYFSKKSPPERRCYPFIFAAGNSYKGLQARVVKQRKKPGTDGTVRICGTTLNTRKCTIPFLGEDVIPTWSKENKFFDIPFAVFNNFNHGSMINTGFGAMEGAKIKSRFMAPFGPGLLILKALRVKDEINYAKISKTFRTYSDENYKNMADQYKERYQQFFFSVRDDVNKKVDDYYLDFYVVNSSGKMLKGLSDQVDEKLEANIYTHSEDKSCRVMMINYDKILPLFEDMKKKQAKLVFDISAKPLTRDIEFKKGRCVIYDGSAQGGKNGKFPAFLYPNTTTLVDIILNRVQSKSILNVKNQVNKK